MRRRPFNFVAGASLVLFVVMLALWARSFASETILLESHRGQCLLIGIDCSTKAVQEFRESHTLDHFLEYITTPPPGVIDGKTGLPPPLPSEHRGLGFVLLRGEWCQIPIPGSRQHWTPSFWIVGVPYWFLALVTVAIPAYWLWLGSRRTQPQGSNLCLACGYDLRATPDRCPECGAVPDPARPVA